MLCNPQNDEKHLKVVIIFYILKKNTLLIYVEKNTQSNIGGVKIIFSRLHTWKWPKLTTN